MSAFPNVPATKIMEAIKETAQHPGGDTQRPDNRWGHGMVRPVEAMAALAS
jgi:hypothetical protein